MDFFKLERNHSDSEQSNRKDLVDGMNFFVWFLYVAGYYRKTLMK